MKTYILLSFLLVLLFSRGLQAQQVQHDIIPGKLFFKIKDEASSPSSQKKTAIARPDDFAVLRTNKDVWQIRTVRQPFAFTGSQRLGNIYLLEFSNTEKTEEILATLRSDPTVEYAEYAPVFRKCVVPNDPYYTMTSPVDWSWHLDLINAGAAWDITTGSSEIVVAVIDDAVWTDHPDLTNKIVAEIDIADNDDNANPPSKTSNADKEAWSHGTHVAGLVAAQSNNGTGVASIGYNVSLMAIKANEDANNDPTYFNGPNGYEGIVWAADNGADVINLSWGGYAYYATFEEVITYAYNKGVVVVAAAGNENSSENHYPSAYGHVISVAAVGGNDKRVSFSNFGSTIDVCAPGGNKEGGLFGNGLLSTTYNTVIDASGVTGNYDMKIGTSMASPVVAGLCGLILSANPHLTPDEVEAILKATCDNIDAENPDDIGELGAGRIDAAAAVSAAQDSIHPLMADFTADTIVVNIGQSVDFTDISHGTPTSWGWTFEGGTPGTSAVQNPENIVYNTVGVFSVTLEVSDASSNSDTETKQRLIKVKDPSTQAWINQSSGFATNSRGIENISIVNENIVWATAFDGIDPDLTRVMEFTKTTNGGTTWNATVIPTTEIPSSYWMSNICALNDQKAYIAAYRKTLGGGAAFKTTDGGVNWVKITSTEYSDAASFPNTVHFFNDNDGILLGDPLGGYFEIYTTTNGGTDWARVPSGNIPTPLSGETGIVDRYDVYGDTIWFSTTKGRVLRSIDKGTNWQAFTTGVNNINTVSFADSKNGVVTGYILVSGKTTGIEMAISKDGGETWEKILHNKNYYDYCEAVPKVPGLIMSVGFYPLNSGASAVYGSAGSLDYGKTWINMDNRQYTAVEFFNANTGWAGSFNVSATIDGMNKFNALISAAQELHTTPSKPMIFPNPAQGMVNVAFHSQAGLRCTIELLNLSGKTVLREQFTADSELTSRNLNISHLKSGAYLVRIRSGSDILTGKMLVK